MNFYGLARLQKSFLIPRPLATGGNLAACPRKLGHKVENLPEILFYGLLSACMAVKLNVH